MRKLELTLACGRDDWTQPLIDGRVRPEGVDLTFLPLRPGETFWRMLNHGEFDLSITSLSSYMIGRSERRYAIYCDSGFSVPGLSAFGYLCSGTIQHREA